MFNIKNALFLSPHTDDAEIGAGGTIHRFIQNGINVYIIAFSWCADERLKVEYANATKSLGIEDKCRTLWSYERREFYFHRQHILDALIEYKEDKPHFDIVFTSSQFDIHQDHQVVFNETLRAFKQSSIFCYELNWNNTQFIQNGFIELFEENVQAKIRSIMHYHTQIEKKRIYFTKDFLRGVLLRNGASIQKKYAEIFHCMKLVL